MSQQEFLSDKEKRVLELDSRRKVYLIVKRNPGCHFREIERLSGLSTGSAQYHLEYLARQGLLTSEKEANNLRYFPKDFSSQNKRLMSILRQRSLRSILLFIFSNEKCNHEQIVDFVGLSPSTVSWHLRRLEQGAIIKSTRQGRNTSYSLLADRNEIAKLLVCYQESFLDSIVDNIVDMWDADF